MANSIAQIASLPIGFTIETFVFNYNCLWPSYPNSSLAAYTGFKFSDNYVCGVVDLTATTPYNSAITNAGYAAMRVAANDEQLAFELSDLKASVNTRQLLTFTLVYFKNKNIRMGWGGTARFMSTAISLI